MLASKIRMDNPDKVDRSQVKGRSRWRKIGRWLVGGEFGSEELWGQKFDRVKAGLSPEQVNQFVEELREKHQAELKQQAEATTPHAVLNRILTQAEQEAAALRFQAQREAEVESARIISEAKEKAQEVLTSSVQQAQTRSEEEARNILKAANNEAEMIKNQAKQVVQLMNIRARENIQKEITTDIKESYYRLLSNLQDLLTLAHNLETEWKGKTTQLWESPLLELGDSPASLSDTQQTQALEPNVKTEKGVAAVPEAPPPAEARKVEMPSKVEAPAVVEPVAEVAAAPVAPHLRGEEVKPAPPPPVEMPVARNKEVVMPSPEVLAPQVPQEATKETPKMEVLPPTQVRGEKLEPMTEEAAQPAETEPARLYTGEVDLVLEPPVDMFKLSKLYEYLQGVPEIKILRTAGSWERGTAITVALDRPMPMVALLSGLPQVQAKPKGQIAEPRKGSAPSAERAKRRLQIGIIFSDSEETGADISTADKRAE